MARKRRKKKSQEAPSDKATAETADSTVDVTEEYTESSESQPTDDETPVEQPADDAGTEGEVSTDGDDLEKERDEWKDKYIRSRAEMDNFRKRKVKELEEARRNAKLAAIEEIMPVMDQFQMAISAIDGAGDLETIKMGMKMIQTTFDRAFENLGVETISCVGETFDPNIHEAVSMEPSDEVPVDHIIREWKSGYQLGDFLIRPATVVVSSGMEAETDSEDSSEDAEA